MSVQEPVGEPSKRQWVGYWSMIVQQTQNAFNDKAAQFILIPLGGIIGYNVESAAGLMIALPFVLFAPLAGWMSDRFSKRNVIFGAAVAQLIILSMICLAVFLKNMPLALLGFFLLAVQSAFFSPAKIGINKELVGSRHLGFAAGVQQMMAMLAILAGQIVAGSWFDHRYTTQGGVPDLAWNAALFPLLLLTVCAVPALGLALSIPKVAAQGNAKLTGKLLFSHFKDVGELWSDAGLRRASFGVAYFWGFAAFINLWSVKVAKTMTHGGEGFGTLSSIFMAAASLGMVLGFGFASWLLRKNIELGWVPVSGVAMTVTALILAFLSPGSWAFLVCLGLLAFFSALFLAPLNAWMQDRYPADQRGELQAAVNLQDCFAGILAVASIEGMILLTKILGMSEMAGFRMQMLVIGVSCALISWFIIRILPADFVRLLAVGVVKIIYRIRVRGVENVPESGGVLLLPNHVTYADSFFLAAACPRPMRFVMDESFMKNPAIRLSAKLFGTVPIRREQPLEAIRKTIEALEAGDVVVLFPEGQLTRTGGLSELERGFELIARKANAAILPMWMDGGWGSAFSRAQTSLLKKFPPRIPYHLGVVFGEVMQEKPDRRALQHALLKVSCEAVGLKFPKNGESVSRLNAYQISQTAALQHGAKIHLLRNELEFGLLETLRALAKRLKGKVLVEDGFDAKRGEIWVGGEKLRSQIASSDFSQEVRFLDFSEKACEPLVKPGLLHLPCLAIEGVIVAVSMRDPKDLGSEQEELNQSGNKAGTFGKILPGFYVEGGKVLPNEVQLPQGVELDEEGFLGKC